MYKFKLGEHTIEFSQEQLDDWARGMSIPVNSITLENVANYCTFKAFGPNYRFLVNIKETSEHINNWVMDRMYGQVAKFGFNSSPNKFIRKDHEGRTVTKIIEFVQVQ